MAKKQVEQVEVQEEVVVETLEEPVDSSTPDGTVRMVHPDGRVAMVKGCMITVYSRSGFKEV